MNNPTSFRATTITRVRDYWNAPPCNTRHSPKPLGTRKYFDQVEAREYFVNRIFRDPLMNSTTHTVLNTDVVSLLFEAHPLAQACQLILVLALIASAPGLCCAQQLPAASIPPVTRKFLGLFDQLRDAEAQKARGTPQRVAFELSDREINEYMLYSLRTVPRPGIDSVNVKIFPHNYISTFTVVDFDAIERWRPGTIPALLRPVLRGQKSIWVDYRFQTSEAKITFSVEKAYYQDIRLPGFVVEKMIRIVGMRQPEKYDTSKPLPLPFGLQGLWTADHVIKGQN